MKLDQTLHKMIGVVLLALLVHTDAGPLCLKCNYAINPDECEQVTRCGDHEECYMQQFVTPGGHILYDLGCKDKFACQNFGQQANPIVAIGKRTAEDQDDYIDARTVFCEACCNSGEVCNNGGLCGTRVPDLRGGRLCFHCDQQFGEGDCDRITLCPQDRFCFIKQTQAETSNRIFYKTGCAETLNCTSQALAYSTRCNSCCSNNLCNSKCTKASLPPTLPTTTTTTTLPPPTTQALTPPNIVTISVNPQHIQSGDHVVVTCIATGNPDPEIVWEMLASPGSLPTNVHGDNQFPARLVIDGFDPQKNAMKYKCYAKNPLGMVDKTIALQ